MNRRRLVVSVGVVFALLAALAIGGFAWWSKEVSRFERRAAVAYRLGFRGDAKEADSALQHILMEDPSLVLPRVVPFLADPDAVARQEAGYLLSASLRPGLKSGLRDEDLPALISAYRNHSWGARTGIGLVGSERAVDFLITELRREGQAADEWQYAFHAAGELARVRLVNLLREPAALDPRMRNALCQLLRDEGKNARESVSILLEIARDPGIVPANRQAAVEVLGFMGAGVARVLPDLDALEKTDHNLFGEFVRAARVRITEEESVEWFALELQSEKNWSRARGLKLLGTVARSVGPVVVPILESKDWDERVVGVEAVGFIGYTDAAPRLIEMLASQDDWEVVFAACCSLGRLRAESAESELERISREHWFPPVRTAALQALAAIHASEDGANVVGPIPDESYAAVRSFGETYWADAERAQSRRGLTRSPGEVSAWWARFVCRNVEFAEFGDPPEVFEWREPPSCGIKFSGGYLLGIDQGEFGAGLLFVKDGQPAKYFFADCVKTLHRMPFGVVAVSYRAMIGGGMTYLAEEHSDGRILVRPFKRLPGSPGASGLLPSGDLYIATEGGAVIITREGEIRLAD